MTTENLKIGARGWCHERWLCSYYPDDLPEDWQLTYYANDFGVVMVPQEYWMPREGYSLEGWPEAVSEDFRFFLEYPQLEDDEEIQRFQNQCDSLGGLLGGVLITEGLIHEKLDLQCPVVPVPSVEMDVLCVGLMEKDFEDLRKARIWLASFDKKCLAVQRVAFVSNRTSDDISMKTLMEIQTLSEMMGL